jgi:hypothetical protein
MGNRWKLIDLTGQRFNHFSVLRVHDRGWRNGRGATFICRCDCGTYKIVLGKNLRNGTTKSCGCWKRKESAMRAAKLKFKHGDTKSAEFKTWVNMHTRCYNGNRKQWKDYGGRGIKIDPRWHKSNAHGYENFLADMGRKPSQTHSIDRIDNDGDYSPTNCRWTTQAVQCRGKKRNALGAFVGT